VGKWKESRSDEKLRQVLWSLGDLDGLLVPWKPPRMTRWCRLRYILVDGREKSSLRVSSERVWVLIDSINVSAHRRLPWPSLIDIHGLPQNHSTMILKGIDIQIDYIGSFRTIHFAEPTSGHPALRIAMRQASSNTWNGSKHCRSSVYSSSLSHSTQSSN
jgi:hypothetical protein